MEKFDGCVNECSSISSFSEELKLYTKNMFSCSSGIFDKLPLLDEDFVGTWRAYLDESKKKGVFQTLKSRLPQLNFPVEKGVSTSEEYLAAIRAEKLIADISPNSGLALEEPCKIELIIHKTPAGSIPVIIVRNRNDFVSLFRALAFKNEPVGIPSSTGACAISGYNNCERYLAYRKSQLTEDPLGLMPPATKKSMYQDSFLLLSDGPYSGIFAEKAGFDENAWREYSLKIRLGHESAHYFTRRCLGSMRNNAHDELIADFAGIREAFGKYDSGLFLKFCGIENFPNISPTGRIQNYKGTPKLSDGAFVEMCALLHAAAANVESFDKKYGENFSRGDFTVAAILCMASLTLDEIAGKNGFKLLEKYFDLI
ncbi:MAG TPA: hypothetical protein PKK26_06320 [Candidatus Wallbacteria bacterium]|nr:hypothetical protein [Candidatus Wallbacteria bacterium]